MEQDTRIVEKLQVYELEEIIKNAPKTYFKAAVAEACLQINRSCKKEWNNDLHDFSGELTGRDTREIKNRDHIRGVYKYSEGQQEKSKLVGVTAIKESVKALLIAFLVYVGLRMS